MNDFEYLKKVDLKKKIKRIIRKYKNKKVIIYGAGKLSDYIFQNYDLSSLNILAVADKRFETEEDKSFHGFLGISPQEIPKFNADGIIIFNLCGKEIMAYLYKKIFNENYTNFEWILKQDIADYVRNKIKFSKPKQKKGKYIFTFWEPVNKIPSYIELCMKTWKKFLPEYEVVVLNYNNLEEWLGYEYYYEYLFNNFSLPKQADAIRAAALYLHGGIWFDADTIITSEKIRDIIEQKAQVTMFNTHLGFICAKKKSKIIKKWLCSIKSKIILHKLFSVFVFPMKYILDDAVFLKKDRWDYLGNSIVDKICDKASEKEFLSLDKKKFFSLPEENYYKDESMSVREKYEQFYFKEDCSEYIYENEKGIICLHNSWTPVKYAQMNEYEFLLQENTIAKILKKYIQ